jgi:hypothetical protein
MTGLGELGWIGLGIWEGLNPEASSPKALLFGKNTRAIARVPEGFFPL